MPASLGVIDTAPTPITGSTDANGQGITWGGPETYNDTTATGGSPILPGAGVQTGSQLLGSRVITSAWSNTVSYQVGFAALSPSALAFGNVNLNELTPDGNDLQHGEHWAIDLHQRRVYGA